MYRYKTKNTCSVFIDVDMEGDVLKDVCFTGGCDGNLQGISSLVKGMKFHEIEQKLKGIKCGRKGTSCPDQLVYAMKEAMLESQCENSIAE